MKISRSLLLVSCNFWRFHLWNEPVLVIAEHCRRLAAVGQNAIRAIRIERENRPVSDRFACVPDTV